MAKLQLTFYPSPILRKKCLDAKIRSVSEWDKLLSDMEETMEANNGVGLAAPQIGLSERIVIIKTSQGLLTLINPQITSYSFRRDNGEEGCLSVPGVFGMVKRSKSVKVTAQNRELKTTHFTARGFFARVIQHEIDHLNGILFMDKANRLTQGHNLLASYEKSS